MSNQENINKALEEYRKGNITLDDYLNICKDNFENKSEKVEAEPYYSHEISRNSVLNFGNMKLIGDSTENEIYPLIESYLREALMLADIDTDIIGIQIIGSRTKGTNKETSDLDVLVEYNNGSLGEDDLFNFLNDEENPLEIDGIRVDFNPITESRSGTIKEWLDRNYFYNKYENNEESEDKKMKLMEKDRIETYEEMKERHNKELNEFPIKFAFDDEQFKEAMEELGLNEKDTDKIVGIGSVGFMRKTDVNAFNEMNKRHREEEKQAIENDKTGEGFIKSMFESELANHEYGYTYDLTDTLDSLGYSKEDIENNENLKNGLNLALEKYHEQEESEEDEI